MYLDLIIPLLGLTILDVVILVAAIRATAKERLRGTEWFSALGAIMYFALHAAIMLIAALEFISLSKLS